jgi:4'-phosphopantetheinyl transferase
LNLSIEEYNRLIRNNSWKEDKGKNSSFQLSNDEIHIWSASLKQSWEDIAEHFSILSLNEQERAKRFYFEQDQNRYIAGRGMLRNFLGNYLGMEPGQIEFSYGAYGKPALANHLNVENLQFNLSHSNDVVVYTFTKDQLIGIDIEHVRPMKDMDDFAHHFFTPTEYNFIQALSKDQKQIFFFKLWTCKEAFLKANGSGLTAPLNQVEISFPNDETAILKSIGSDTAQAAHWHFKIFNPVSGYQAAIAVEGYEKRIIFNQLDKPL